MGPGEGEGELLGYGRVREGGVERWCERGEGEIGGGSVLLLGIHPTCAELYATKAEAVCYPHNREESAKLA